MAFNFTGTQFKAGPLISVDARTDNSSNWVSVPDIYKVQWRTETLFRRDVDNAPTTGGDEIPITFGTGGGIGQRTTIAIYTDDLGVIHEFMKNADVQSINTLVNFALEFNTAMQIRWKMNTRINVNNFRYATITAAPVVPGVGYATGDWSEVGQGQTEEPKLYRLPFTVAFNSLATRFNTTNSAVAGVRLDFSNT